MDMTAATQNENEDVGARTQTGNPTDSLTASTAQQRATPGPWDVRLDAVTGHGRERAVVEDAAMQFHIADCGFASSKVAVANARLIAAAPDLLAALKAMIFTPATRNERRMIEDANAAI